MSDAKKLCPLMSSYYHGVEAGHSQTSELVICMCFKDECGFWNKSLKECSICSLPALVDLVDK